MTKSSLPWKLLAVLCFFIAACGDLERNARASYFLLDTSGTYPEELKKAQGIVNYLIAQHQANDSLSVARLDSTQFSSQDVVASAHFAHRPSLANSQKRVMADAVNTFVKTVDKSTYSDVGGAVSFAVEQLRESKAENKNLIIFTDLLDSVPVELVEERKIDFSGMTVITISATSYSVEEKRSYRLLQGLTAWEQLVQGRGGEWKVIFDLSEKEKLLSKHLSSQAL